MKLTTAIKVDQNSKIKKLWNYIWYSPLWLWTHKYTGETKDSPALLKIVCLLSYVLAFIIALMTSLFF